MPSTTLSPQARIVALVGVLLVALAGSAFFLLRGHAKPVTVPVPATHPHTTPSGPVHVVRPTVNVNPLLPAQLHLQLEHYPRVVVGFYNPHSPVDSLTIEAARAAAQAEHVPFISVNLLNNAVAGPLTALLPSGQILPNPGFAIYKRPGTIVFRSDGYLDQTAVSQAITDTAPPGATSQPTVLFYTSHPKAALTRAAQVLDRKAGFSDIKCRLYAGNQQSGWQHLSCVGNYDHSGTTYRFTAVVTPRSCSEVSTVDTIAGVGTHTEIARWDTSIFTCKVAQ